MAPNVPPWFKLRQQPWVGNAKPHPRSPVESMDKLFWERNYDHHRNRVAQIDNRQVTKPKIIKREYQNYDPNKMAREKARQLRYRTKINTYPLDSKQSSPAGSPMSSRRNSFTGTTISPGISPYGSRILSPTSKTNSTNSMYLTQMYPVIRSVSAKPSSHYKVAKIGYKTDFSDYMLKKQLGNVLNKRECTCGRHKKTEKDRVLQSMASKRTLSQKLRVIDYPFTNSDDDF